MPSTGKDEDFKYTGDSVYEGILSMEQGERALRNNNPGAINYPSDPNSVFITQFGAVKNPSQTYYEYTNDDGERVQVWGMDEVPEDKRGDVKEYTTATFPNKEMGEKALQHIIREKLKSADGDIDKFVQSYTGLKPGSSEFNAYKQKLSSGEVDPSLFQEIWQAEELDAPKQIAVALGTLYAAGKIPDAIEATGKAKEIVVKNTTTAIRNIQGLSNISASQAAEFLDSPLTRKQIKNMNKVEDLIKKTKNEISKIEGLKKVEKTPEKIKRLKQLQKYLNQNQDKLKKLNKNRAVYWAEKWFGKKYTPQQLKNVEHLWGTKGRHGWGNIFRLRKNVLDNLRDPKHKTRFGKWSSGLGTGTLMSRAFGVDWAENFGVEGALTGFATNIAGDYTVGRLTEQALSSNYSKLKKVVNSPKGRKWLAKKVGTSAMKKIVGGTLSGGGFLSLLTGAVGVGMTAYDIYNLLAGDELDEIVNEIE